MVPIFEGFSEYIYRTFMRLAVAGRISRNFLVAVGCDAEFPNAPLGSTQRTVEKNKWVECSGLPSCVGNGPRSQGSFRGLRGRFVVASL